MLIGVNIFTFFLTVFVSPSLTFCLLVFPTLYFLYIQEYKDILFGWCFFFFLWYLVFTFIFIGFEGSILIGGDFTTDVLTHLLLGKNGVVIKYPFLERFCLETVILLHTLSEHFKFTIYIPSIFNF